MTRRFLQASPLEELFDFVDAKGAGGQAPGTYALVGQYPRRVITPQSAPTIAEAQLRGQEALLLEPILAEG